MKIPKELFIVLFMFDFHKLTVYQKAKQTNREVLLLFENSHTINRSLKDQLIRASSSILLNIAEGSGRQSNKDKKNFYIIAKGSTYECIAILDIFLDLDYLSKDKYMHFYLKFEEITKMIFGLIKSLESKRN
jgi:four helix bundle protein